MGISTSVKPKKSSMMEKLSASTPPLRLAQHSGTPPMSRHQPPSMRAISEAARSSYSSLAPPARARKFEDFPVSSSIPSTTSSRRRTVRPRGRPGALRRRPAAPPGADSTPGRRLVVRNRVRHLAAFSRVEKSQETRVRRATNGQRVYKGA